MTDVPTFHDFARGPGGQIARRLGVPCDGAETWRGYAARFLRYARDSSRLTQIRRTIGVLSTGETAVALALLHAVDLSPLADEMSDGRLWRRLDNTFGEHRLAVIAAILRLDTVSAAEDYVMWDDDEEADHG